MGQSLVLLVGVLGEGDNGDNYDSMDKLARWQHEWHITAESEAKQAIATGHSNSMTDSWVLDFHASLLSVS